MGCLALSGSANEDSREMREHNAPALRHLAELSQRNFSRRIFYDLVSLLGPLRQKGRERTHEECSLPSLLLSIEPFAVLKL